VLSFIDPMSSGEELMPACVATTTGIEQVFLHVTKACNLRCAYCYYAARRPLADELTTDELLTLWPDLVAIGPRKLVFTGGEPLLRHDLLPLIERFASADADHRTLRCLNTNGLLVTKAMARRLVGLVDEVRVSIDALRARNDRQRGEGTFDAAVQALDRLCSVGFLPKALVTVTSESLPDLEALIEFLVKRGITRINVNVMRAIGRGAAHPSWTPAVDDVRARAAGALTRWIGPRPAADNDRRTRHCGVGHYLNITARGDVFPCHVLKNPTFRCGSIRQSSLVDICAESGLLGRLRNLDFVDIAARDKRFTDLTKPESCMGVRFSSTRRESRWRSFPVRVEAAGQEV